MSTAPLAVSVPSRNRVRLPFILGTLAAVGVLLVIGLTVSMLVAGLLFAVGFLLFSASRPQMAIVFIWGAAPFIWDVGGGPVKMAVSEFALVVAFIAFVLTGRIRRVRNALSIPICSYFAVCLISVALNGVMEGTLSSMIQMAVYLIAAVLVFSTVVREPTDVLPALAAYVTGNLVLTAMLFVARSNYAFGVNKNNMGACLGLGFVTAVGLWMGATTKRNKRLLACAMAVLLAGLVFTLSRGAWIGAIAGTTVMQLLRRQWKQAAKMILLMLPVVGVVWAFLPAESKEYATDVGSQAWNIKARYVSVEYAMSQFNRSPVVGVGTGLRKTYDATNVVLMTMAETGVAGLITFFSIFVTFAIVVWRASKRIDLADPAMVLLTVGAGLMTDKLVHGFVDHYWVRGILPVWAGAGLAIEVARRAAVAGPSRAQARAGERKNRYSTF